MRGFGLIISIYLSFSALFAGYITPQLLEKIRATPSGDTIRINIIMSKQSDISYLQNLIRGRTRRQRRQVVISYLKGISTSSQKNLLSWLKAEEREGRASEISSLWIVNAISCAVIPDLIETIANFPGVKSVDWDEKVNMLLTSEKRNTILEELEFISTQKDKTSIDGRSIEWNIAKINAPQVWDLGYRGQGIIVAILDTGVNYDHNDLKTHMWSHPNYPHHGYDFANDDNDPKDDHHHGHGTHCAGIVAGDGSSGKKTGVAPEAMIMALKVLDSEGYGKESDVWEAIQFGVEYGADILSLSIGWDHKYTPDRYSWRVTCNNALVAGVIMSAAAGNNGELLGNPEYAIPFNLSTPGDVPPPWLHPDQKLVGGLSAVITAGATDDKDEIADFSSKGPVTWENVSPWNDYPYDPEMGLIKPDVCAPGVNIVSLRHDNNSGYREMSGTSMACPHVSGLLALLLSANPDILPERLAEIIQFASIDLGKSGKDNDYGAGRIDALRTFGLLWGYGSYTEGPIHITPVLMDIDRDGKQEVFLACDDGDRKNKIVYPYGQYGKLLQFNGVCEMGGSVDSTVKNINFERGESSFMKMISIEFAAGPFFPLKNSIHLSSGKISLFPIWMVGARIAYEPSTKITFTASNSFSCYENLNIPYLHLYPPPELWLHKFSLSCAYIGNLLWIGQWSAGGGISFLNTRLFLNGEKMNDILLAPEVVAGLQLYLGLPVYIGIAGEISFLRLIDLGSTQSAQIFVMYSPSFIVGLGYKFKLR